MFAGIGGGVRLRRVAAAWVCAALNVNVAVVRSITPQRTVAALVPGGSSAGVSTFMPLAFSASLGVGVLFSTIVILVYQGGLTLLAAQAQSVLTTPMINEMTAVGGLLFRALKAQYTDGQT